MLMHPSLHKIHSFKKKNKNLEPIKTKKMDSWILWEIHFRIQIRPLIENETSESMNTRDSNEGTNPNSKSLGGMARMNWGQFIYSKKSWANPTMEIDIDRNKYQPTRLLLDQ